jgi:lysine 2,3-aminomutase
MRQDIPDVVYDRYNEKPRDSPVHLEQSRTASVLRSTLRDQESFDKSSVPQGAALGTEENTETAISASPAYFRGSKFDRVPYWQKICRWRDVGEKEFLSYHWNTAKDIQGKAKLYQFLQEELPENMPDTPEYELTRTREAFIKDVIEGIDLAPMSIRLTPHIISSINWKDPLGDPISRQYIPKKSTFQPDHPKLELDSLHESDDSPVEGLVHRYTDKCLFLASSHCPLYCRYCTRSYAVGADTETVTKASLKPQRKRWEKMLEYIAATPVIQDVVVSGGDSYSLMPQHLAMIGSRLLDIPHIRRFRIATKGLCVSPSRTLDPNDAWTDEMIKLSNEGRKRGKHVALHTHFQHPNEFSWVSREAAQKLFANGVTVRNQSVLLKGVNDDVDTMKALIRELGDNNIQPYYVYAGDLVKGVEDLRTPLSTILSLEGEIRGSIAGFMIPQFVVDLPGGGGKRLAASYQTYDRKTGRSTFVAPAVHGEGKEGRVYEYYDPLASLPNGGEGVDFGVTEEIIV